MLVTDRDGVILWVNQAFTTNTGYAAEEAIGKTPRILKSGAHGASFYRAFWETILAGRTWRSQFTNRRKDGSISYDVHTVTPVFARGTITHFVGVMHDVTERKLAEERLRQTHEQLREVLAHSPAVLYALEVEGAMIVPKMVSENVTRLLGYEVVDTLSSEWWRQKVHPEDLAQAEASIRESLDRGSSRTEYRLRHKRDGYRWVEDHCRLVVREGRPVELVGVWTDVTDRKNLEEELRESERRFHEMLNNLELIAMMLDRTGRITYCNDSLLRRTGWSRDEVLGGNWFTQFLPPDSVEEVWATFLALLKNESWAWHHTNEIVTRSGERRLLQWNNSVLRSASGEVIGTASIAEDITERVILEKKILRTQRLESLGALAGGIAHDLNNVLMPVLMGVTLLRRSEMDAQSQNALENIERAVRRGRDLVKQVVLFASGTESTREAVYLGDVLTDVKAIVSGMFPESITIDTSVEENLMPITGDSTQLTQVLLNLSVNARDAMPEGGRITISAQNVQISDPSVPSRQGAAGPVPHVLLKVSDTGEGIPMEIADRIFEPFFTTKKPEKGTGLGLATVQRIVTSHGGFINVSSTPGEGSTFVVHFPARLPGREAVVEQPVEPAPEGNGELILVADADASVLGMTKQTLETYGYRVLTAGGGAHALAVFSRHQGRIALVVTDMDTPVIDGPALVEAIENIELAVVPVLLITAGYTAPHPKREAPILRKPFTADELLRAVHGALA